MKTVFVVVTLFIIMNVLSNVCGYIACKSTKTCSWCGFCTDETTIKGVKFTCFNPYNKSTRIFGPSWGDHINCEFNYGLCNTPMCKNNGICHIIKIFAGPFCKCEEGYMGQFCEIKWDGVNPDSWYSGFPVIFDNFKGKTLLGQLYSVSFIAPVFSSGKHLQFSLETSDGYVIRFNKSTDYSNFNKSRLLYPYKRSCNRFCGQYLPRCEILFEARVQFPYKIDPDEETFVREGVVKGYVAQVIVEAKTINYNSYQVVFRHTYPVVVEYEELFIHEKRHSMPVIQLQNCGRNLRNRVIYFKNSAIRLNFRFKDDITSDTKIVWGLWDVETFRNYYESPDISQIDGRDWNFEPFTLNFTVYRVEVKVTSYYHVTYSLANYADCYFEVRKLKIVALISGGSRTTINNNKDFVISGKTSYNPNVPKNDQNLNFVWRCTPQCDNLIRQHSASNDEIIIPKDMLDPGKIYNFTLNVRASGFEDDWTFQEVYVSEQAISVFCLMNCLEKVDPYDPLLLEVKLPHNEQINRVFNWTKIEGSGTELSADDMKCKNYTYPSYLLCVEPNTMSFGEIYQFNVKLENSDAHAGIQVSVGSRVNFSCVVSPTKGTRLKTIFSISCSKPKNTKTSWVFEFFDKYSHDLDLEFGGRMIATNSLGVVRDFSLVRGLIVVYLFDVFGVITTSKHLVELAPYNATEDDIEYLLGQVKTLIGTSDMELAINKASLVSDLIHDNFEKREYIAKEMVQLIGTLLYESQGIMKLGLRTVYNFITSLKKEVDFKFNQNMLSVLARTIDSLLTWTTYAIDLSRTATPPITKYMFDQMATASVEAIESLLTNRNTSFLDISLDDLSSSDYDMAREASRNIESALQKISYALSFRQASGYAKSSISSIPRQSLVTAKCDYLSIITTDTNRDEINPLMMSRNLIKELSHIEKLTIHLTSIGYNPFWTSRRDISTNLISLDMYNSKSLDLEMTRVRYIKNYIDLFLDVENSSVSSIRITVKQLDPLALSTGDIDANLTVLRFDLAGHSQLFMSFKFHNSSDEIKIFESDMIRPNYDLVNTSKSIISSSNPNYAKTAGATTTGIFVYIGFLPGPNVPINGSINVTIYFYYQLCLTLNRLNWVSQYCRIGPNTNSSKIHCSCSHLSFFSAVFAIPPNEINPFTDIRLFLTLKDNWFIIVLMSCVVTVFLLLGIWARLKDASDRVQRTVLLLEDNFSWDSNCYLLAVFTGCRINAGTTANVGVHIYGSESSSRCHILKSSKRKVLRCNSQDWFLFRTPQPLGSITKIHIWHDNSGRSPDWYCNKVIVYDLHTSVVYTFFVEEWLALKSSEFCEAIILPATSEDITDIRRIFMDNVTFGFRYVDLGCGILTPHPRSRVSRLVNVVIVMNITMMVLLVSLLFYKYTTNPDNEGYDSFGFTFRTTDIIITIETFIITTVVIGTITLTFTKAHKPKKEGKVRESVLYTRPPRRNNVWETISNTSSSTISNTSKQKFNVKGRVSVPYIPPPKKHKVWEGISNTSGSTFSNTSKKHKNKSYYHRLVKRVQTTYNHLPLRPVSLSYNEVKKNRILYSVAWFMSVVLITSCLFFIILYGLKLGQEESKTWLATISLILLQEFVILSPLKIGLVAILLASNFQRFVQISSFDVLVDELVEAGQSNTDLNHITSNYERTNSIYKPISLMRCNLLRENLRVKKSLFNLLDFLIVIATIIIICLFALDYSIDVECHANLHAAQMVLLKHNPKHVNFQDVYNRSLYYDYLNINFANTLFASKWYNSENLNPSGLKFQQRTKWWTMDKITKLVGPTKFRQIRVDPKKCSLNEITENSSMECIPNWGPDVEDDDDYGYGWRFLTYEDTYDKSSAWKYVLPSQSACLSIQGETWTTYHGGGYITSVSSDKLETEFTVQVLTEDMWINEFTRVVFLDFTLFNVNENMFTDVTLIAEHLPFGLYVTRTMINSVQLDMVQSNWKVALILFIMIIIFYIIRIVWLMNREGFVNFCLKLENLYQICVTSLGVLTVILYVCHLKVSVDYIERFQRRGFDVFFNFEEIIYYSVLSDNCLTVLFCCLCFRLLTLWPFGGSSRIMYRTLFSFVKTLARLLILMILYIFIFCRLISYLLSDMLPFSTFYWHWAKSVHKPIGTAYSIMVIILCLSVKLCLVYILLFFCYQYKLGKVKKEKQIGLETLFDYFMRLYIRPNK